MDVGLEYIHSHGDANIMIASHNIDSIKVSFPSQFSAWTVQYAISRMESLDISRSEGKVFFGQLLGMCDQLTFPLGQAGYPAYKVGTEWWQGLNQSQVRSVWTRRRCSAVLV